MKGPWFRRLLPGLVFRPAAIADGNGTGQGHVERGSMAGVAA